LSAFGGIADMNSLGKIALGHKLPQRVTRSNVGASLNLDRETAHPLFLRNLKLLWPSKSETGSIILHS
jgi:hypothetical protein